MLHNDVVNFVRELFASDTFIPLHAPLFVGRELEYVQECISSSFVSTIGEFVDEFENTMRNYTSTNRAVATVNGSSGLHTALVLSNIENDDLVLTQSLSFVATCNAILTTGARPIFIDVSEKSLSLCPKSLSSFLVDNAEIDAGVCRLRATGQKIKAVLVMHTFGHPAMLAELQCICDFWGLVLIEDAAEALGSFYETQHVGTFGRFGVLSFNGNKVITTGGGGMILCKQEADGESAKHITTTGKVQHAFEFFHDQHAFNYRMPNINAALGCAQMEMLEVFLRRKRALARQYELFFSDSEYEFIAEPDYACSNYWLNAVKCTDKFQRDELLSFTNAQGVMTRPIWQLMHTLPMYRQDIRTDLSISEKLQSVIVNLPSSPNISINFHRGLQ